MRSALRGALSGLVELHAADMVHQSISPNAVLVSTTDDRVGDRASGMLAELGFCRDAPSLELVYRASPDGTSVLPAYEGTRDLLDSGLLDRAARKCRRPGDPENRAAFGKADDMREFALLVLGSVLLPNAQPGQPLEALNGLAACAWHDNLGRVSDEELVSEYQRAKYVLALRKYEGFESIARSGSNTMH